MNPVVVVSGAAPVDTVGAAETQQAPPTRTATRPFDRDDADIVLRSSDGIDFYVHRIILSLASPVFATMLALPQPPGAHVERPVVDMSEDSQTLDIFLRVCYPEPAPEIPSLHLLREVLGAAMKYDAAAVMALAKDSMVLPHLVDENPLDIFVMACCFGLEAQAQEAAVVAVASGAVVGKVCPGLDEIPAGVYQRLLQFN
ncbi:hypothetical protein OH77DRAFT_1409265, partial [Trametes cingulata]